MQTTKPDLSPASAARVILRAVEHDESKSRFLSKGSDDALINGLAIIKQYRAGLTDPCFAAEHAIEEELGRRLLQRRKERGGDATIAMPHPNINVKVEAQYGPYEIDAEQLEEAAPALDETERAKLIKIIPEHTIPAQVVPRQVLPGNTASIKALESKYAGTEVGKIISAAIKRTRLDDKITIQPKATLRLAERPGKIAPESLERTQ